MKNINSDRKRRGFIYDIIYFHLNITLSKTKLLEVFSFKMSKRQSTLIDFIAKKKIKLSESSASSSSSAVSGEVGDIPEIEILTRISTSCCSSTSSMITRTAQEFENKATASISFNSETRNVDVGLYVANTGFSDAEKINLLKNSWEPPETFTYLFSTHRKITRTLNVICQKNILNSFDGLPIHVIFRAYFVNFVFYLQIKAVSINKQI